MRLHEIQDQFKSTLLQQLTGLEKLNADFSAQFEEGTIPTKERLKVYHNNVIGSISKALAANFPLLEKLVGQDFLMLLCRTFVIQNPPKSGCLNNYGHGFDLFIANHLQTQNMPYLADIARLELATQSSYHAKDDLPLEANTLAKIVPDQLSDTTLQLRDSCKLLQSNHPLLSLREFCLDPHLTPPDLSKIVEFQVLVFRPQFEVQFITLTKGEYIFLENIKQKETLGNALSQALESEQSFDIGKILQKHLLLGTFKTL